MNNAAQPLILYSEAASITPRTTPAKERGKVRNLREVIIAFVLSSIKQIYSYFENIHNFTGYKKFFKSLSI